jgi:hypothetical protein
VELKQREVSTSTKGKSPLSEEQKNKKQRVS